MFLHKHSVYSIRRESDDHLYQCHRTVTDFIKRFVNHIMLNAFKIIDNLVCKKQFFPLNFIMLKFSNIKFNRVNLLLMM